MKLVSVCTAVLIAFAQVEQPRPDRSANAPVPIREVAAPAAMAAVEAPSEAIAQLKVAVNQPQSEAEVAPVTEASTEALHSRSIIVDAILAL